MFKKIIAVLAMTTLLFTLAACDNANQSTVSKLPQLTEISEVTVKDKAILLVDGSADNKRIENMLADYANRFNVDIQEVVYGSDWTAFETEQNAIVNAAPSESSQIIESIFAEITDQETANNIYNSLNEALNTIMTDANADISTTTAKVAELMGNEVTGEDITAYVKEAAKSYSAVLTGGSVDPLNLPQLIIFSSVGETGRIQAFSEYPEEFAYLAASKGLRNVEKTSTIKEVEEKIKNKETFVAVFSSSTCLYCYDTVPLIKQKAATYNIPVIDVNLSSNKNIVDYEAFMAAGYLTAEITGTPTTIYFKDGVIQDTQSGLLTATQINSLFVRNK